MENQDENLTVKMMMKNGAMLVAYANPETVSELTCHPKYLKMQDKANDIFISLEDITAFEIMNFRKEEAKEGNVNTPEQAAPQG